MALAVMLQFIKVSICLNDNYHKVVLSRSVEVQYAPFYHDKYKKRPLLLHIVNML